MDNNILSFLGLMHKAGSLALGGENAYDAARTHRARLLVLAEDCGPIEALRRLQRLVQKRPIQKTSRQQPRQSAAGAGRSDIGHEILNRHFDCRERFACFLLGVSSAAALNSPDESYHSSPRSCIHC